jgi:hypothetical protein
MRSMVLIAAVLFIVIVMVMIRGRRGPSVHGLLRRAKTPEDLDPVIAQAAGMAVAARSLFYQRAIGELWAEFRRDLAIHLIRAFGASHADEKIAQYWMKQAIEVEPALARKAMDQDFIDAHYRPSVAKQCGLTGS